MLTSKHYSLRCLDKDTAVESLPSLMAPINDGQNIGVLSESGCPGVADPGAMAVAYAHKNDIQVIPLGWSFVHPIGINGFRIKWSALCLSWICAG